MKSLLLLCLFISMPNSFAAENEAAYNLFKSKTYVKNPLDLRDPFKRKINKKKSQIKKESYETYFSNVTNTIESKPLESIRVIGVMIGADRRAMAKVNGDNDNTYYLKEGMKVGPNGAEVKAILPGGVVLVEKIRNVYDQDEYLETVIPLSDD